MLIDSIAIEQVLPCLADPAKIRFHAHTSADLTPVLPYLNAVVSGAIYNHAALALTFNKDYRIITLHPQRITGAKVDDLEDARAILDSLSELINDTWERRADLTPSYERRERLTPLAVYKLLPGTSCRQCGSATCLAFAVELAAERASVLHCPPLFQPPLADKRRLLIETLADAGYEVPSAFREPNPED
jgi:ArsR family metal-binding transcriptional regulator